MKKYLFIFFSLILALPAFAQKMNVRGQEQIAMVRSKGIGGEHFMESARNGNVYKFRVKSIIEKNAYLEVDFERTDNVLYVRYEDIELNSDPSIKGTLGIKDSTAMEAREFTVTPSNEADLSEGTNAAGAAAATYLLVTNSKTARQLQKLHAEIEEIYIKIQQREDEILDAQDAVANAADSLNDKIKLHPNPILSEPVNSLTFNDLYSSNSRKNKNFAQLVWLSKDKNFVDQADRIRKILVDAKAQDRMRRKYYDISKESLLRADTANFTGQKEMSEFLLSVAQTTADIFVGIDPFTGTARSLYETILGENLITGAKLSSGERVIAALGILTAGYVLEAWKIYKHLLPIAKKLAPKTIEAFYMIKNFISKTGNGFELVGKGSVVRRVHLKPAQPSWGLTRRHLDKHFWGNTKFSLRNIDPAGNADKWIQNITDVFQRPITYNRGNDIVDIYGFYQKSDNSGFYRLGVRLHRKEDGTFNLVTVLTDQERVLK